MTCSCRCLDPSRSTEMHHRSVRSPPHSKSVQPRRHDPNRAIASSSASAAARRPCRAPLVGQGCPSDLLEREGNYGGGRRVCHNGTPSKQPARGRPGRAAQVRRGRTRSRRSGAYRRGGGKHATARRRRGGGWAAAGLLQAADLRAARAGESGAGSRVIPCEHGLSTRG